MWIRSSSGNSIQIGWNKLLQLGCFTAALLLCISIANCSAQEVSGTGFVALSAAEVQKEVAVLVEKAKESPGGIATEVLDKYPGSTVLLSVRVESGRAELHTLQSDYMVILDGEGLLFTGGRMIGAYQTAPNEVRGVELEGASRTPISKGSVVHVPPNTPHQTMVAPGSKLVYVVVKVARKEG